MKPLPAPHVPGKTEFERFDNGEWPTLRLSKGGIPRAPIPSRPPLQYRSCRPKKTPPVTSNLVIHSLKAQSS